MTNLTLSTAVVDYASVEAVDQMAYERRNQIYNAFKALAGEEADGVDEQCIDDAVECVVGLREEQRAEEHGQRAVQVEIVVLEDRPPLRLEERMLGQPRILRHVLEHGRDVRHQRRGPR